MTPTLGFILPGGMELWIILAIFLLLFGHRIPGMARSMGSGIVEFKKGLRDGPDDKSKGTPKSGASGGDAVGSGSKDSAGSQTQDSGASNG